ncbi:23S rRNA (uridine(2552)-2'-O)-methyltransferase [Candidatus Bathyarchaeota archaeon]|nr:MAG: 23S rRNA (uridine(2552)-2'-O)-methyltransferase [Candidatus Bathyarchaeota archaeon]
MPKSWIKQRKKDYYYRKAKEEKFRSRAAYKLLQAVKKYKFMKRGDVVVDLGAAPGGWIQASRRIVGKEGFILGVDLKPIEPFDEDNILTIVADITDSRTPENIKNLLPRPADVVISDVSPKISGIWEVDHARQIDLALNSLKIACKVLKKDGNFFVKVFEGDMLNDFMNKLKENFSYVKLVKPKASRAKSSEIYVLALGLRKNKI